MTADSITLADQIAASGLTEEAFWLMMRLRFMRRNIMWNIGEYGRRGQAAPDYLLDLFREANKAIGDNPYA